MSLKKTIDYVYTFGRYILLFTTLILLQMSGLIDPLLETHPALRVEFGKNLTATIFLISVGRFALLSGISQLWNRLTPVKDKATYIETQFVDLLAFAFGTGLFSLIFIGLPFLSSCQVMIIIGLAYLPSMALGWGLQKWYALKWPIELESDVTPSETVNEATHQENFWRKRMAYVIAAIIFNIATTLLLSIILYLKTGGIDGIVNVGLQCTLITFITLIVFGKFVVGVGHKFLKFVHFPVTNERVRHALAYVSGYLLCLSLFVGLCLFSMYSISPDSLMPWWAYGSAYMIVALSALIAGIGFSYFYTPRNKAL